MLASDVDAKKAVVRMEHVTKHFGGVYAVNDVSFDLYEGEILALVGDNGAGKSTLVKILSGAHQADEGTIYIRGKQVKIDSPMAAQQLGIETLYQNLALMNNLDITANIFMGREIRHPLLGWLGLMNLHEMRANAMNLLNSFDLAIDDVGRSVNYLSGGQRQMVAISRAVYFEAQIIIMDEPTAALGVAETRKVYDFIEKLRANKLSVIIISHNINEVFNIADRFMILKTGRLVGIKRREETSVDEIVTMIISGQKV